MDYDVIVIGGGPAGLTAALYAGRARLKTLIVESFSVLGQAIITDRIENYPGFPEGINGFDLVEKFKKQAEKFEVEFKTGDVSEVKKHDKGWEIKIKDKSYTALSLIVASGAKPKKLGVAGEEKLQGKGVSYCATCDGALYRDKEVVLAGGGDTAIEEALFLTRFAAKVKVAHRRDRLRATKILQERALANKKIEFIWESTITEITGDNKVSGVKIENVRTKEKGEVPCDGVFIFVGYSPNTDFVKGVLKLDKGGYIAGDDNMKTSEKGIFACGDCRGKLLRQVVTACGDGAVAAFSAQQYVEELKGVAYK
ncbi:MAG: thioredoxin-disulfide reductase [Candidatus Omnitrophica bacterium]|nr:thioredoxin-disulfide reductase [Candidatus Omnitrophota bacterium]